MKCAVCGKREAQFKYVIVVFRENKEIIPICSTCLRNKLEISEEPYVPKHDIQQGQRVCPRCGLTYEEFLQNMELGCSTCYETFGQFIKNLLVRTPWQKEAPPKGAEIRDEEPDKHLQLYRLKRKLQELLDKEAYEEAAKIRDKIREIENELRAKGQKGT